MATNGFCVNYEYMKGLKLWNVFLNLQFIKHSKRKVAFNSFICIIDFNVTIYKDLFENNVFMVCLNLGVVWTWTIAWFLGGMGSSEVVYERLLNLKYVIDFRSKWRKWRQSTECSLVLLAASFLCAFLLKQKNTTFIISNTNVNLIKAHNSLSKF